MSGGLRSWLLEGSLAQPSISVELQRYLSITGKLLIIVSALACVFIAITLAGDSFKGLGAIDLKLDGQTLANYVGLALGTVVSLAGSFVAIMLAVRANDTAERTKRLEESRRLSEIGQELSLIPQLATSLLLLFSITRIFFRKAERGVVSLREIKNNQGFEQAIDEFEIRDFGRLNSWAKELKLALLPTAANITDTLERIVSNPIALTILKKSNGAIDLTAVSRVHSHLRYVVARIRFETSERSEISETSLSPQCEPLKRMLTRSGERLIDRDALCIVPILFSHVSWTDDARDTGYSEVFSDFKTIAALCRLHSGNLKSAVLELGFQISDREDTGSPQIDDFVSSLGLERLEASLRREVSDLAMAVRSLETCENNSDPAAESLIDKINCLEMGDELSLEVIMKDYLKYYQSKEPPKGPNIGIETDVETDIEYAVNFAIDLRLLTPRTLNDNQLLPEKLYFSLSELRDMRLIRTSLKVY